MTAELVHAIAQLAASHDLAIDPASIRTNEAGLDYRVAFARTQDGADWVLRMPRRADVSTKIAEERRILDFVRPSLPVAIPDWRVCSEQLVAYPLLPGKPGLTLDESGAPVWHIDPASPAFARSLGKLIAALHRIDSRQAANAGLVVQSPSEVRAQWCDHIARVAAEFTVADALLQRWQAWLDDDSYWPTFSRFTHGELYPAHVLIDADEQIVGVLDWTTAKVTDPAVDFAYQRAFAGPAFELTVQAYVEEGGVVPPRLADHCTELFAAGPVLYGIYALTTGRPEHRAAAAAALSGA